jgi:hypothetical protein
MKGEIFTWGNLVVDNKEYYAELDIYNSNWLFWMNLAHIVFML